jgi:hypothetical protein
MHGDESGTDETNVVQKNPDNELSVNSSKQVVRMTVLMGVAR